MCIRDSSLSTVDSCVGRSYDLIIFDEAALGADGEAAFNVALRPTLDKPNSKAIFISTPRGKNNWFSKFFDRGFTEDFPEWCSITADYTENSRSFGLSAPAGNYYVGSKEQELTDIVAPAGELPIDQFGNKVRTCLLYTSPSPRDRS